VSIDDLYPMSLVVKTTSASGVDADGQPVVTTSTLATVSGDLQAVVSRGLTGQEVPILSQAGVVISTHRAYIAPLTGLDTGCWIEYGGERYDVVAIAQRTSPRTGAVHHLEVDLRRVVSP
jgi:hypothetical protein